MVNVIAGVKNTDKNETTLSKVSPVKNLSNFPDPTPFLLLRILGEAVVGC
jgi:hypothetical protein